jgi:hypothetical protein
VSVLCDQVMYKFPYIVSAFAIYLSYVFFDMDSAIDAAISNLGNIQSDVVLITSMCQCL